MVGIHTNSRGQPTDAEIGEEKKRGENTEEHYKCHNHGNNFQHMAGKKQQKIHISEYIRNADNTAYPGLSSK